MAKKQTREVEYFRCWDDGTWDTDFIDVPADTPDDKLHEAVQEAALKMEWRDGEMPAIVGYYSDCEDE